MQRQVPGLKVPYNFKVKKLSTSDHLLGQMVSPQGKLSFGSHAILPDLLCSGAEETIGKI